MSDWDAFLNFKPATAAECQAASQCQAAPQCGQSCGEASSASSSLNCKKITDILGETVMGKDGPVAVASFAKPGSVVGLFFSGHWCPPSRSFTPTLINFYNNFKSKHKDKLFEIVFISSDRSQAEFDSYYREMPWLAVLYDKREEKQRIGKKFNVTGIPTLILLDGESGDVITRNGRDLPSDDPHGNDFPWKPRPFNDVITEGPLIDHNGVEYDAESALRGKIVGVFFSGDWCPPSHEFTPHLISLYNYLQTTGKQFEVVFCSWDRSQQQFDKYFASMPWLAVPFKDKRATQLKKLYNVSGIPHLSILDEEGKLIERNGRARVEEDPFAEKFPWYREPLMRLYSGTLDLINSKPTVLMIAEEESEKPKIEEILLNLAKEHHAKGESQEIYFMYITKDDSSPGQNKLFTTLLSLCALTEASLPALTVLDISNKRHYTSDVSVLREQDARQLVSDFSSGRLTGEPMRA